ncbi:MAG: hypothetical protein P8N02_09470 [Actinomycetota bacterium]|nr:hypothetical protein [Actinomycetota bacterium]
MDLHVVGCSGVTVDDLWSDPVSGGTSRLGGEYTQLDWALAANPGLITLTVGANDLRFDSPGDFFDGGVFLSGVATRRVDAMRADLDHLVGRLVSGTDAADCVHPNGKGHAA